MANAAHEQAHLAGLIEAARAEAARLGPEQAEIVGLLDEVLDRLWKARNEAEPADEGLRADRLTTENDR